MLYPPIELTSKKGSLMRALFPVPNPISRLQLTTALEINSCVPPEAFALGRCRTPRRCRVTGWIGELRVSYFHLLPALSHHKLLGARGYFGRAA